MQVQARLGVMRVRYRGHTLQHSYPHQSRKLENIKHCHCHDLIQAALDKYHRLRS